MLCLIIRQKLPETTAELLQQQPHHICNKLVKLFQIFRSMISEIKANFKNQGCNLLYTDGSKSQYQLPAYAIVDDEGRSLV